MIELEQGTEAWLAARCGRVTASRIADLMAKTKSGWGASRANYAAQLVAERLTGCVTPSFTNAAMIHGTETEPEARRAYEFFIDRDVQQVGFVPHPSIEMAGASPDGMIGDDGLLELKCPNTATHIDTLLTGAIPDKYFKQMQFQMACTGREWCDFASYDNRLPERMRLFVKRVERDAEAIAEIETEVRAFIAEIDDTVAQLRARYDAGLADALTQSLEAA
jgi:putative phage-type endonuclease